MCLRDGDPGSRDSHTDSTPHGYESMEALQHPPTVDTSLKQASLEAAYVTARGIYRDLLSLSFK